MIKIILFIVYNYTYYCRIGHRFLSLAILHSPAGMQRMTGMIPTSDCSIIIDPVMMNMQRLLPCCRFPDRKLRWIGISNCWHTALLLLTIRQHKE